MAEETIPVPKEEPSRRWKEERRVCVRFPTREELGCRLAAACPIEQASGIWFGRLWDLSRTGAALLLTRPFEEGNALVIELPDPAKGDPRSFLVHVAYAPSRRGGHTRGGDDPDAGGDGFVAGQGGRGASRRGQGERAR